MDIYTLKLWRRKKIWEISSRSVLITDRHVKLRVGVKIVSEVFHEGRKECR